MLNSALREKIVSIIYSSGEGHIPSSFSVIDIINFIYLNVININSNNFNSINRDYFILSKGHAAAALFAVLHEINVLSQSELDNYGKFGGNLGGHPDCTKVPGAEASTGSLGHGFPTAVGIALGLKIKKVENKVICLLGDGECQEGTVWEAANIASNQSLGNLCAVVDWNGSAKQLMPIDDLKKKWEGFGWDVFITDGHSNPDLERVFSKVKWRLSKKPTVILAKTVKGKGVSLIEGHGIWHHKIPDESQMKQILLELKNESC